MTSLDFPSLPPSGATHTEAGLSWRWLSPRWTASSTTESETSPPAMLAVTASRVLPAGFTGTALVEAAAPLILTLPPAPVAGQAVTVKDAAGNAETYPITISGGGGVMIDGAPTLVINFNHGWSDLIYGGVKWLQV